MMDLAYLDGAMSGWDGKVWEMVELSGENEARWDGKGMVCDRDRSRNGGIKPGRIIAQLVYNRGWRLSRDMRARITSVWRVQVIGGTWIGRPENAGKGDEPDEPFK